MKRGGFLAVAVSLFVGAGPALASEGVMNAGALAHAVDRLASTGRVLYVAAHPDDENTRLLAYLANERHVRAAYLSMTRGGGGQNLIGPEQGPLLDVIRTEELLSARALDGAEQYFTRMRDFGYAKTPTETFAHWDHEAALSDVVRVVRSFQPDVIVTRFDETPPNHGHHTASAILAREAFAAAADPKRFPDQLVGGVQPWQAKRLLHNTSSWRGPPPPGALPLDVGGYDPRLGLGYGELAARSRSQHKSQGFGVQGERGVLLEHFVTVAGSKPEQDLLEGVALGFDRFGPVGKKVGQALAEARGALTRDHPEQALPHLLRAHEALAQLPPGPRVTDARVELRGILLSAAGLFVRATARTPTAVPGAEEELSLELVAGLPVKVRLKEVVFPGAEPIAVGEVLERNVKKVLSRTVTFPAEAEVSAPYWLAQPAEPGRYAVQDARWIGAPRGPPAAKVAVALDLEGVPLRLQVPVVHAWTDRVHGERVRPFLLVPPATVTPLRDAVMLVNGKGAEVALRVSAGADGVTGNVWLELPAPWKVMPVTQSVSLKEAGDETVVRFTVRGPAGAAPLEVRPVVEVGGKAWSWREDVIDYPHLPYQLVLQPATLRLAPVKLSVPTGRIGYVQGAGDSGAEDLSHVGATVEPLDDDALRAGNLKRYAAIVIGIRAYNTRPALRASHARLMKYVEQGGVVVVQYVTSSRWAPLEMPIGPYPLEIGRDRVTDETAKVDPVRANHPLWTRPNRLTDADFTGWVQERGLYFAKRWDDRYEPLFRAGDPGEEPLLGGTLVARHGKGRYVYTGLSFFRQLRAGVPGAYRLFANLVARP